MAFQGYSTRAEEQMYKQMVKTLKLHHAKHAFKLSPVMQQLAYNG